MRLRLRAAPPPPRLAQGLLAIGHSICRNGVTLRQPDVLPECVAVLGDCRYGPDCKAAVNFPNQ